MVKNKYTIGVATVKMSVVYKEGKIKQTHSEKVGFVAPYFSAKDRDELSQALQVSYKGVLESMDKFEKITVTVTFETLKCNEFLNKIE